MNKIVPKVGDIYKYSRFYGEVIEVSHRWGVDNVHIKWDDKSVDCVSFEYVEEHMKLATYTKSPLWKKLEGIK